MVANRQKYKNEYEEPINKVRITSRHFANTSFKLFVDSDTIHMSTDQAAKFYNNSPDSMTPLSPTTVSRPFGKRSMKFCALAILAALVICSTVIVLGSMAP